MAYPISNTEIVTSGEVKAINNITSAALDTFINNNIPVVSRAVENYCRRRFCRYTWTQWVNIERELMTDNWPINNVLLIGIPYEIFTITDTTNAYNFTITQTSSNNISIDGKFIATNTQTFVATEFLFSTYPTVAQLKTAVESTLSGVTFTYQNNPTPVSFTTLNTLTLRPTSGKTVYAGVNYFDKNTNTGLGDIYRISDDSDRIIFNPNFMSAAKSIYSGNYMGPYTTGYTNIDAGGFSYESYNENDTLLVYDAGYTTANMPQELKWVVAAIINDLTALYNLNGNGLYNGMKSETLGDYSYTIGDKMYIYDLLNKYKDMLSVFIKKII